jgi:hypothetical protein
VTVTVDTPQAHISANPTQVAAGGSTVISWYSSDIISCSITKNDAPWQTGTSSNGVTDPNISGTEIYVLTCKTAAGPDATDSVTVTGSSVFQEF